MIVYRITKSEFADDLSGEGAAKYGGRWNDKGVPIVYTAGCASLAALEVLVHLLDTNIVPLTLSLIYVKDDAKVEEVSPDFFSKNGHLTYECAIIGTKWATEKKSLLLKVPSVIVPIDHNFLLNPLSPEFDKVDILEQMPFEFDKRLRQ